MGVKASTVKTKVKSSKLSVTTITKKDIMPLSIPRSQKTNADLGNFHAGDWY